MDFLITVTIILNKYHRICDLETTWKHIQLPKVFTLTFLLDKYRLFIIIALGVSPTEVQSLFI